MLHAKGILVDETAAYVGSANLNRRSLYLDEELLVVIRGGDIPLRLVSQFERDLIASGPLRVGDWSARGAVRRLLELSTRPLHRVL